MNEELKQIIKNQEELKKQLDTIIKLLKDKPNTEKRKVVEIQPEEPFEYDPLLKNALEIIIETQMASTSFIQRNLVIGYARAGRIIDQIEGLGIISGYKGSKPRTIFISQEDWKNGKRAEIYEKIDKNEK